MKGGHLTNHWFCAEQNITQCEMEALDSLGQEHQYKLRG